MKNNDEYVYSIIEIDGNEMKEISQDEMGENFEEIKKYFYRPFCNEEEINRIMNVKNANDYLLKLRADIIADNMRLFRVFKKRASCTEHWNFENSFKKDHFEAVLNSLSWRYKRKCKKLTFGNIFSTEPNGITFETKYGPIVTIDDSLNLFFEYINLGIISFSKRDHVPGYIQKNALRIAIRIMMKTETLDFEMDPRGLIPEDIKNKICSIIPMQLRFVTGHEFAHYILGHLKKTKQKKIIKDFFKSNSNENDNKSSVHEQEEKFYTATQKEEFLADIKSIEIQSRTEEIQEKLVEAALMFFAGLSIYEAMADFFSPPTDPPEHPPAIDRFDNIARTYVKTPHEIKKYRFLRCKAIALKKIMIEDASLYWDNYEMYGSVYLDKPNTKWRGRALVDRVDY